MKKYKTILWVGDCHDDPVIEQDRFTWLGNFIAHRRPDYVVFIGDVADFLSLCLHDKIEAAKSSLALELKSLHSAIDKFMKPVLKVKGYNPKIWICEGNHEARLRRFRKENSHLAGFIPEDLYLSQKYGFNIVPYAGSTPGSAEVEGVVFAHYFVATNSQSPIGVGKTPAKRLAETKHQASASGHSHVRDWHEQRGHRTVSGLLTGKYFEHFLNYAGSSNNAWWDGLTVYTVVNAEKGYYDPEFISMERIKEAQGKL